MIATIKLNPTELLSRLEDSNSSGFLELNEGLVSWKVYLQEGELKYIDCSAQLLDQLKYYLHYLGWKQAAVALKKLPPSYVKIQSYLQDKPSEQSLYQNVISWLLAEKHINTTQGLQLIEHITKDALNTCLWLDRGSASWHHEEPIPLWIREQFGCSLSLRLSECLNIERKRLEKWQNCSEQLLSVHQRPYFTSGWEQKMLPRSGSLDLKALKELALVIRGRTSIRQLSLLLHKDELQIAQILSPYIDDKIIYLRNAQPPLDRLPNIPQLSPNIQQSSSDSPVTKTKKEEFTVPNTSVQIKKIVCIDDSPTILNEMQRFLDRQRFEVTAIDDPVQAVSIIFRIKPDLILLDITMPKINGYKLCSLLRGSDQCDRIPIIMVTGNTGLIDKARAKLAGATDYFTKPFTQEGLLNIVQKYLQ